MKSINTIILLFLLASASCKKDAGDPLPPETHTGAFTFGCKVDGKVYATSGKPEGPGLITPDGEVYYDVHTLGGNYINISASKFSNPDFDFYITIPFIGGTGTYALHGSDYSAVFQNKDIVDTSLPSKSIFRTTDTDTGSITITYFDGTYTPFYAGTILAGTFQMDAVNGEGKMIHITDGRFDIGR